MKFTVLKSELRKKFLLCSATADSRSTIPVLENVIITAQDDNTIVLMSTNNEISTLITMNAEVESTGITSISAKMGSDILSSISWNKEENITFNKEEDVLYIECGHSKFNLPVIDYEEYPEVLPVNEGSSFKIDFMNLKSAVKFVKSAVSKDFLKENLKGIFIEKEEEFSFNFVATDSRRLAFKRETVIGSHLKESTESLLVSATVLENIVSISEETESVNCFFNGKHVSFYIDNVIITSSLIEAPFPNYKMVIPQDSKYCLKLDKKEFSNVLKSLMPVAKYENDTVEMIINSTSIDLSSSSQNAGVAKQKINLLEEIQDLPSEEFRVKFNIKFLLNAISVVEEDEIEFKLTDAYSQAVISIPERNDYFSIIMPVKLY